MGKTIFITGASAGFGAACAKRFAQAGHKLILMARRLPQLQELADSLEVPCHLIAADIREPKTLASEFEQLPSAFQDIDVLVNNAGLALDLSSADQADFADWQIMIDTNVTALAHCTHLILPRMVAKHSGHVVNMGSIAGNDAYPGANVYGATKAFVRQFSRNLRADMHGKGIRVTNIEPGLAETEFSLVRFKGDKNKANSVYEGTQPLTAADVAEAVFWATEQPSHVNINTIELMPTCQSWGPLALHRGEKE